MLCIIIGVLLLFISNVGIVMERKWAIVTYIIAALLITISTGALQKYFEIVTGITFK